MTIEELKNTAIDVKSRLDQLGSFLKIDDRRLEMADLDKKLAAPDFWGHKEAAQAVIDQQKSCRNVIDPYDQLVKAAADVDAYLELAADEPELLTEAEADCQKLLTNLDKLELLSFLGGKFDRNNVYFTIHAGAGGTESCDWANMLLRMYRRYFERQGWSEEILDLQPGEEAGVKSVTLHVSGEFAYGYMRCEKGIHRLVRISPFDSNARRHTSFASVDAVPELNDDIDIEIDEKDLRVDTYRSSGKGGQGVNTTDSAVRLTHLPTGTVVCCQNERSQHKNKATAMRILKAKLYELEEDKRRQEADSQRDAKGEIGWGNQIRSYVLQPYQMVKDLRTEYETSNTSAVLDGEIQAFIEACLRLGRR